MQYCKDLFDLKASVLGFVFSHLQFPWEILSKIGEYVCTVSKSLTEEGYREILPQVWVGENVTIAETAAVVGPTIIGHHTEIRHCAYIRGNVVIGNKCVVGNSSELKNSILFDNVQVPHYNYVGDSILGKGAHLGAGTILSNLKSDRSTVKIMLNDEKLDTGMRKFGALIGDGTEIGCGCVLNPGTIIGRGCRIYPLNSVRGILENERIYKSEKNIVAIQ